MLETVSAAILLAECACKLTSTGATQWLPARPCNRESPEPPPSRGRASAAPVPQIHATFGTTRAPSASEGSPRLATREIDPGNNCAAALPGQTAAVLPHTA